MKIYTKTGDKGTTRLVDGACVEKFNAHVESYGTVDELNSYLGIISSHLSQELKTVTLDNKLADELHHLKKQITVIQNELFIVGSLLATTQLTVKNKLPQLTESSVEQLEFYIDKMNDSLPELKNFILPSGHVLSSHYHFARTICRRAERRSAESLSLLTEKSAQDELISIYLNRLSDYLFMCARFSNDLFQYEDILWKKN